MFGARCRRRRAVDQVRELIATFAQNLLVFRELFLRVLWPRLNEETANETEHFSDLEPCASPRWLVEARFDESHKLLRAFRVMAAGDDRAHSIADVLVDELLDMGAGAYAENKVTSFLQVEEPPEFAAAFDSLTQNHTTDATKINFRTKNVADEAVSGRA